MRDKRVVVTGSGAGIGREIALHLAREGAQLACVDIDGDRAEQTARDIEGFGGWAVAVPGDVSSAESVERFVFASSYELGGIDTLVNNAGTMALGSVEETSEATWDRVMALNVKSVYLVSRVAAPHLRKGRGPSIVNIASGVGLRPAKSMAAYGASKAAVVLLSRNMALDLARDSIRVNCICPGMVETDLSLTTLTWLAEDRESDVDSVRQAHAAGYPLGRLGRPEDVAPAVAYLASDAAGWVTGAVLAVDGGRSMGTL